MRLYKTPTSFVIVVAAIIIMVYSAAAAIYSAAAATMLSNPTVLAKSDNETSTEPLSPDPNNCDISSSSNHNHKHNNNDCNNDNDGGNSGHKGKGKGNNGDIGDLLRETEANRKLSDSRELLASKGIHGQIDLDSFSVISLNNTHYNISWTSGQDSRSYIVRK